MTTEDLYNTKDTTRIRELLLKEQQGNCACTDLEIPPKTACLDHIHNSECFVRGVLHRQVNSYIGKCENNYVRMIKWWYPGTLPDLLRQIADYLEDTENKSEYRHPSWIKSLKVSYNKLSASQQNKVLLSLGSIEGSNPAKRKELFSKIVLDRSKGFVYIADVINQVKEKEK